MELSFERKGTGRSVDEKIWWLMELCLKLCIFCSVCFILFFSLQHNWNLYSLNLSYILFMLYMCDIGCRRGACGKHRKLYGRGRSMEK